MAASLSLAQRPLPASEDRLIPLFNDPGSAIAPLVVGPGGTIAPQAPPGKPPAQSGAILRVSP